MSCRARKTRMRALPDMVSGDGKASIIFLKQDMMLKSQGEIAHHAGLAYEKPAGSFQFMVGMTKLAPSLTPDGQRAVTVLVLV
jgi:hypothetical protein